MADPDKYSRTYSFTDYQAGNPSAPLPGIQVDNELENVEQSLGEAIDAIKDVRRSDGKLKNSIVTVDSLDPTVAAGVGAGALASAEAAAASADVASDSAVAAAASATAASGSATAASGYASNALTSRNEAETQKTLAQTARTGAQTARDYASKWATEAEDVDVNDGVNPVGKSAYHWAQVALDAAAGSIADGSVTTAKIADGALSADTTGRAKMADGFVTSAKILDGTIATGDIADSAITSAKIADGTIATGDLADGSVTAAKAGTDFVSGQAEKTTPVDADAFLISDSGASNAPKKLTFANLKAWIRSWLPVTAFYESAEQTITTAGALSLPHGLGGEPSLIQVVLICKTANAGYSVNDKLVMSFHLDPGTSRGVSVVPTSTTLEVRYGNAAAVFSAIYKGTGGGTGLTNTSWRAIFRAWR